MACEWDFGTGTRDGHVELTSRAPGSYLNANALSGIIPSSIGKLSNLTDLYVCTLRYYVDGIRWGCLYA